MNTTNHLNIIHNILLFSANKYPTYLYPKNYFPSTAAMGNPHRTPSEAMKTMATSTAINTSRRCHPPITSNPTASQPLPELIVTKYSTCNINSTRNNLLTGLREIPTGISLPSSTAAVVAHRFDDGANHAPQPRPSLSPTTGLTISCPSPTLQGSNASIVDVHSTKHPSSINITILRESPTRNSLHNSLDAVIDPLDHDDDDRNTKTTTMTHPPNLEGNAAPLPYQKELAAISATIKMMKQHDNNITPPTHSPPQQPFDTQSKLVEMSTALD